MTWITPDPACTCACSFYGTFLFDNETCLLTFLVTFLRDGCDAIPADEADITIEITGPGGVESPGAVINAANDSFIWTVFTPEPDAVYTASVTLTCGADTLTQEFSYTVAADANDACNCCSTRTLDYVVVSGLTGDFAVMNGTYAATKTGSGPTCFYDVPPVSAAALPTDPCGVYTGLGPPVAATAIYQCTQNGGTGLTYYWYPGGGSVTGWGVSGITVDAAGVIQLRVQFTYTITRFRYADVSVPNPNGCTNGGIITCGCSAVSWDFSSDCNNGTMTLSTTTIGQSGCSGGPSFSQTPTVELFFE